ncbi:YesL family protein [Enterococcus timonensis]|uniref:YesL family protein n=1 Tax=Enterococcus timonensis TaxID=1852364 RepID=UPI0008DAB772|nr:DUF624 domain-containing protein [Enterococcus timonensis]
MESGTWTAKMYRGLSSAYMCAIFTLLFWFGFILGLGIFGLAPSLRSIFHLAKLNHRHELIHPVRTFFHYYKKVFFKANQMLWPIFGLIFFILWDTKIILSLGLEQEQFFVIFFSILQVILLLMITYSCSLSEFYELKVFETLKKSFQFTFYNLAGSVLTLLITGICFYLSTLLPGLIPFFSIGFWINLVVGIHLRLFEVNEEKLKGGEKKEHEYQVAQEITKH